VGLKRDSRFYKGKGCQDCLNTGYKGRISIFELLAADEPIQNLIVAKSTSRDIRRSAEERGMRSLKEDGLTKVLAGLTTLEEVLRVTEEE
jgi:type II secretory ATPase GspE/PulE/Tfp pilus assembly ATPase PilB-like protein